MAESHDALAEYKEELDSMMTSVMPDTWVGFGRLKIRERDLSEADQRYALRLLEKVSEKYPDVDSERLAEKVIEKAENR